MLNTSAQTLLLLSLWDLNGLDQAVSRGKVIDRVKKKGEKVSDYTIMVDDLEEVGAIEVLGDGNTVKMQLKSKGLTLLSEGLRKKDFKFAGAILRAKTGNALLRWVREMNAVAVPTGRHGTVSTSSQVSQIDSYEAFKVVALETFDKLNQDFNLDNLVPIYRIRRTIGNQTERNQFNDWLLKMQADRIFRLQGGSVEDSALDKIEDSIQTEISGLRCYAKRLVS